MRWVLAFLLFCGSAFGQISDAEFDAQYQASVVKMQKLFLAGADANSLFSDEIIKTIKSLEDRKDPLLDDPNYPLIVGSWVAGKLGIQPDLKSPSSTSKVDGASVSRKSSDYPLGPTGNLSFWHDRFVNYCRKGYSNSEADMLVRSDIAKSEWVSLSKLRDGLSDSEKIGPKYSEYTAGMKAQAAEFESLSAHAVKTANARVAAERQAAIEEAPLRAAQAQERAADMLEQQSSYLRQIRDNQDAVNPNAPTRY